MILSKYSSVFYVPSDYGLRELFNSEGDPRNMEYDQELDRAETPTSKGMGFLGTK